MPRPKCEYCGKSMDKAKLKDHKAQECSAPLEVRFLNHQPDQKYTLIRQGQGNRFCSPCGCRATYVPIQSLRSHLLTCPAPPTIPPAPLLPQYYHHVEYPQDVTLTPIVTTRPLPDKNQQFDPNQPPAKKVRIDGPADNGAGGGGGAAAPAQDQDQDGDAEMDTNGDEDDDDHDDDDDSEQTLTTEQQTARKKKKKNKGKQKQVSDDEGSDVELEGVEETERERRVRELFNQSRDDEEEDEIFKADRADNASEFDDEEIEERKAGDGAEGGAGEGGGEDQMEVDDEPAVPPGEEDDERDGDQGVPPLEKGVATISQHLEYPPTLSRHPFAIDKDTKIIVCLKCRIGVDLSALNRHSSGFHKETRFTSADLELINDEVRNLGIPLVNPFQYLSKRATAQPPILTPLPLVPSINFVAQGFLCGTCHHASPSAGSLGVHQNKFKDHTGIKRGIIQTLYLVPGLKNWVLVQTPSNIVFRL